MWQLKRNHEYEIKFGLKFKQPSLFCQMSKAIHFPLEVLLVPDQSFSAQPGSDRLF